MNERPYTEKPASLWDIADIEKLAGTQEDVYLEFKKPSEFVQKGHFSRDVLIKELTETVSAFLNSDGGVILVGVQTEVHGRDRKTELLKPLAGWSYNQSFENLGISLTAYQIQDLIYGNIVPKPMGIEVKSLTVPVGDATATVFAITVLISPLGAHQSAKTWRYYRRTADGDEPMLDFEIRAVNSRRAGPILDLACKGSSTAGIPSEEEWKNSHVDMNEVSGGDRRFNRVELIFATSNLGRGTADIARFDIGIPNPWVVQRVFSDGVDAGAYLVENTGLQYTIPNRVIVFWTPEKCREIPLPYRNRRISEQEVSWKQVVYSGGESPSHPIWPASGRRVIGRLRLHRPINGDVTAFLWLPWRAFAGDMLETKGAILLTEATNRLYIVNYEMDEVTWWHQAEEDSKFEELKDRFQVP